jgi:hypothetical protein
MIQYTKKTLQVSEHIPLTYTGTRSIRCPFYPSEFSGFSNLHLHDYLMYKVPPSDPEFFSLDCAMLCAKKMALRQTLDPPMRK